ncbi:ABC-type cobalamin/Fe3+-siderophores transport system, ATpase component [Clostridium aceticum]|uniref:ABC-type cobalamin/Fe3+-siderophores transport system, ATpase component n=1 Tax=Clostridium aceticum TaxID=84022 RepID=A0A0G3WCG6_9CLOT|nr:ABC transporter ATP-binding protein [Clostridium aceticum]AKL96381.1 ABC-type cobalamin/Fe3+-siderophores transport system, ATpase component [Clostridium aceticum]
MLETKNLNFSYGKEMILKDINFNADHGEVISLIGPNGSGKSTLLRCLSKLLVTKKNEIYLLDKPLRDYSRRQIAQKIAFLPQMQESLKQISIWELVAMGRSPYHDMGWSFNKEDREKISWAIDYMKLSHLQHRFLEALSGGERQRAWIAMVLAQDTPIVLLDEPVTYMDLKHQWDLLNTIINLKHEFGKTVISVFHDINHALEVSDYIYLLKNGEIYGAGTSKEVITEKALREVYGICAHVCQIKHCCRPIVVPIGVQNKKHHQVKKKICKGVQIG